MFISQLQPIVLVGPAVDLPNPQGFQSGTQYFDTTNNILYVLKIVANVRSWQASSATPSGPAGGDLSGTYPNPTVVQASNTFNARLSGANTGGLPAARVLTLTRTSTLAPAPLFGAGLYFTLDNSANAEVDAGIISTNWVVSTAGNEGSSFSFVSKFNGANSILMFLYDSGPEAVLQFPNSVNARLWSQSDGVNDAIIVLDASGTAGSHTVIRQGASTIAFLNKDESVFYTDDRIRIQTGLTSVRLRVDDAGAPRGDIALEFDSVQPALDADTLSLTWHMRDESNLIVPTSRIASTWVINPPAGTYSKLQFFNNITAVDTLMLELVYDETVLSYQLLFPAPIVGGFNALKTLSDGVNPSELAIIADGAGGTITFQPNSNTVGVIDPNRCQFQNLTVETQQLIAANSFTNTEATPGNAVANTLAGRAKFAAGASTVTITNSQVTANSNVWAVLAQNDATLTTILRVVPGAGSFTITANAAATGTPTVNWEVKNIGP